MTGPGGLEGCEFIIGVMTAVTLAGLRVRRVLRIHRLIRNGLERFISCKGREQWGTRDLVSRWRSQAISHVAIELSLMQYDIWQIQHRIENLKEMEGEARKKKEELNNSLALAKERNTNDPLAFIKFEIRECDAKITDIIQRISRNRNRLQSLRHVMNNKKSCIKAYKAGKNPRLPLAKSIKGYFFS
jgi:predicted RNase H-like nuclease (RuvC/YqgF family)